MKNFEEIKTIKDISYQDYEEFNYILSLYQRCNGNKLFKGVVVTGNLALLAGIGIVSAIMPAIALLYPAIGLLVFNVVATVSAIKFNQERKKLLDKDIYEYFKKLDKSKELDRIKNVMQMFKITDEYKIGTIKKEMQNLIAQYEYEKSVNPNVSSFELAQKLNELETALKQKQKELDNLTKDEKIVHKVKHHSFTDAQTYKTLARLNNETSYGEHLI